jgi:threonine/homoserine/homoserine lactone efflux protein
VIVTPGQDTALTIRNALAGQRRAGIATAFGVSSGQLVWTLATSMGAAALLAASETAFQALRVLGAAYLIYLGAQALRAALRPGSSAVTAQRQHLGWTAAFRRGLVSNLSNPKMLAFFPSLLPQFVAPERTSFEALFALGVLFSVMTLVWLVGYAYAIGYLGDRLRRPRARRLLEAATGTVLVALGIKVLAAG